MNRRHLLLTAAAGMAAPLAVSRTDTSRVLRVGIRKGADFFDPSFNHAVHRGQEA